jgi:hypothetical protein
MPSRSHVVAGVLLAALALPAAAQAAPIIEPLKPCYVTAGTAENPQGEGVSIRAAGFTPDSRVNLTRDGEPLDGSTGLQVRSDGLLEVPPFPAEFVRSGSREFTVTLTEQGNEANTVSATAWRTALDVSVKPREARPSQRIRFKGSGFTEPKPVYAHYVFAGKQRKRVRMVGQTGHCGGWKVRRPQFPMKNPSQGSWIVQFDQSRKYVNGTTGKLHGVFVRLRITIRLVPR